MGDIRPSHHNVLQRAVIAEPQFLQALGSPDPLAVLSLNGIALAAEIISSPVVPEHIREAAADFICCGFASTPLRGRFLWTLVRSSGVREGLAGALSLAATGSANKFRERVASERSKCSCLPPKNWNTETPPMPSVRSLTQIVMTLNNWDTRLLCTFKENERMIVLEDLNVLARGANNHLQTLQNKALESENKKIWEEEAFSFQVFANACWSAIGKMMQKRY